MKRYIILILIVIFTSCAAANRVAKPSKNSDPGYVEVLADRLSYHLSNYISEGNGRAVTQSIYLEMHYNRIKGILVFDTEGKYIDGFMKDNGEIRKFAYTVYFKEPENTFFIVKKIFSGKRPIGVIKVYYK